MHGDPTDILDPLIAQAKRTLAEMAKTKDLAERKTQSEIVHNLCQSLGVFFSMFMDAAPDPDEFPFLMDDDDE
jgi:hypothetical protein